MSGSLKRLAFGLVLSAALMGGGPSHAIGATITIACGAVGIFHDLCRAGAERWAAETGNAVEFVQSPGSTSDRLALFQQLLAAGAADIDVIEVDVIWPGILGRYFIDLGAYVDAATVAAHFPVFIENNTVDGELKALPWFSDVGLLYYRKDLLEAHGFSVPQTWAELAEAARAVVAAERASGSARMTGFVFQGKAYEGLTCNALEWIDSFGGGQILAEDGSVTVNNPKAVRALETVASWIGVIAPRGVLGYMEEDARGVFQSGNAVFMRNWPYAWALAQAPDSPVKDKVGVAPLPAGRPDGQHSGTLGGAGLAVSKYSPHPEIAADLVRYLASPPLQAERAIRGAINPTIPALYEDPEVLKAQPFLADLLPILEAAVARPSQIAGERYNQLSTIFWNVVHDTLAGRTTAETGLAAAERHLQRIRFRDGW
ncbi:ABC transporter substrate-binding protein [Rhodospirillaceae bacterium SYSU D60014]|uniref:ABC transporter substrate-binding protein n=1 Tax=Virgifigura deserti TaxID=2268457 RepID=UPI000E66F9B4